MSPQAQAMIGWWEREHTLTMKAIGALPPDQTVYKPHEKSMSAQELAWHIATAEAGLVNYMVTGQFGNQHQQAAPATFQAIIDWSNNAHQDGVSRVSGLSDETLSEMIEFFDTRKMPRIGVLNMLIAHEIHHRGQLSVYIRLAGGKVPSIYGGSADEPR